MQNGDTARQVEDKNITVNSVHPGTFLNTKLVTEAGINPQGEAESGAAVVAYLAITPELNDITGKYFDRETASKANAQAYDAEARKTL